MGRGSPSVIDARLLARQALFLHARAHLPRDVPHEVALAHADRWAAWLPRSISASWQAAEPAAIEDVLTRAHLGRVVRVVARVSEETQPTLHPMPAALVPELGKKNVPWPKVDARRFTLGEPDEATLETLPICHPSRFASLYATHTRDRPHEHLLLVMAVPTALSHEPDSEVLDTERTFACVVLDVRVVGSARALIGTTTAEARAADALLLRLKKKKTPPWRWLASEATRRFHVAKTDAMEAAIELCVLSALSHGMIGGDSARLHLLFVSAPGQGKGLLLNIVRTLSLRSVLVSPNDVTVPGLRGASRPTTKGWTQRPGLFFRSDGGALAFPDAHALAQRKVAAIMTALHGVMDRGLVGTGTTGTREARALVSVCMDANRARDMGNERSRGRPRALGLHELTSMLSRMDGIVDIPDDDRAPWATSKAILSAVEASATPHEEPGWSRELRVIVATLIDRHPIVELGKVRPRLMATQDALRDHVLARKEVFADHAFLASRIAMSRAKLAVALARGSDRSVAIAADVEEADRLAWLKIASIERMRVRERDEPKTERASSPQDDRRAWYRRNFGGKEASRAEIRARYEKDHGQPLPLRTLERDLEAIGARRASRGRYLVPR